MTEKIGFTESAPGTRSMMRLAVLITVLAGVLIIVVGLALLVLSGKGSEIVAIGTGQLTVAMGAKVGQKAIEERN